MGLLLLDDAITVAAAVGDPGQGASALCEAGLHALNREDFVRAEAKFRSAIELLSPDLPDLLATLHHNLAVALLNQGNAEAVHHATTALDLRNDPHSDGAQEDRKLLDHLRGRRERRGRRGLLG